MTTLCDHYCSVAAIYSLIGVHEAEKLLVYFYASSKFVHKIVTKFTPLSNTVMQLHWLLCLDAYSIG